MRHLLEVGRGLKCCTKRTVNLPKFYWSAPKSSIYCIYYAQWIWIKWLSKLCKCIHCKILCSSYFELLHCCLTYYSGFTSCYFIFTNKNWEKDKLSVFVPMWPHRSNSVSDLLGKRWFTAVTSSSLQTDICQKPTDWQGIQEAFFKQLLQRAARFHVQHSSTNKIMAIFIHPSII